MKITDEFCSIEFMDDELTVQSAQKNFSTKELLRLLAYLEGEIQARDIVIAALKVNFFFTL